MKNYTGQEKLQNASSLARSKHSVSLAPLKKGLDRRFFGITYKHSKYSLTVQLQSYTTYRYINVQQFLQPLNVGFFTESHTHPAIPRQYNNFLCQFSQFCYICRRSNRETNSLHAYIESFIYTRRFRKETHTTWDFQARGAWTAWGRRTPGTS